MTAQFDAYIKEHSLTDASIEKFGLKELTNQKYGSQLVIPIKNTDGNIIFNKYRNLEREGNKQSNPKYVFDPGSHETTFNSEIIKYNGTLILFEGEIDVIRADQESFPGISGTNGAMSIPDEWAELLRGKDIYICYDTDETGRKAIYKLANIFPKAKIISLPTGIKDFSDFMATYTRQDFIELIKTALPIDQWQVYNPPPEYKALTIEELYTREYPEENWIVEKFLPQEGIVMFSGDAGVGKSFISLEIIRALTDNDIFLDHFEIKTPNVPILLIDKENGLRRIQARLRGLGVPATQHVYTLEYPEKFSLENKDFMQAVSNLIQVKKIGIVILDSFIDILIGEENDSADTAQVFNSIRSIANNILWVILHHESKPIPRFQTSAINRARGSSNIKAQVDYLFSLLKAKSPKVMEVEQGKARDYEALPKFAVEFLTTEDGQMSGFRYIGEVQDENTKVDEAISFVETYLTEHPYKMVQEIIDTATGQGIVEASINRALKILKEKHIVDFVKGFNGADKRKSFYFLITEETVQENGFIDSLDETEPINNMSQVEI